VWSVRLHIYRRQATPRNDEFYAATNGHSIGHWRGDTLELDTIYFNHASDAGIRMSNSHLTENFRFLINGENACDPCMEDAKLFTKPRTYPSMYYKVGGPGMPRSYTRWSGDRTRVSFLITKPKPGTIWPAN
jgi:hypothetical protein